MLNRFFRYYDIIRYGDLKEGKTVLEVGSGSLGVGEYFKGGFVGCDMSFPTRPVRNMTPIRGSALRLPFSDNSFDVVISSDMLEHLENEDRALAIQELIRVTRDRVILGCPQGSAAFECDKRLSDYYDKNRAPKPDWLLEHLETRFPTLDEIRDILHGAGASHDIHPNESVAWHYRLMILETKSGLGRLMGVIEKYFAFLPVLFLSLTRNFGPPYRSIVVVRKP